MPLIDSARPAKLYYVSEPDAVARALSLGEFRLDLPSLELPTESGGMVAPEYLVLSLTTSWDGTLFDAAPRSDACLLIRDTEEFGERMHRAVQHVLPNWAGIDGPISYGVASPLGKFFSKSTMHFSENEWRFAWRPMQPDMAIRPVVIQIGNILDIADRYTRNH